MTNFPNKNLCPKCNHPLRPGAKFCSSCGNPCPNGKVNITNMRFSQNHWSLVICYILFGISIIYSWFWRDLYNWYVDLFKDYGSHIYWTTSSQIYDVVRAVLVAIGTMLTFHFEVHNKKKTAIIAAVSIFPCLLITEIVYCTYQTQTMGEFYAMMGINTSISPLVALDIVLPALLICFILWNNKLQKISFLFPIINILCFLLLKRFDLFAALASSLGMAKYWVRRIRTY